MDQLQKADLEESILSAITLKKEELIEWVKTADALVVSEDTLDEANSFRKKGKNYRLEIQRIAKSNNDELNKLKKINSDREDEFIVKTGLEAAEKKLGDRIKAIEDAVQAERQKKIKAEEDRKRGIKQLITDMENRVSLVRNIIDIKELELLSSNLSLEFDSFEEFSEEGNAVINQLMTAISNRIAILEDEKKLQQRREAKINSRKEFLENYPSSYWPSDEDLLAMSQEDFEDAIIDIDSKYKADQSGKANIELAPNSTGGMATRNFTAHTIEESNMPGKTEVKFVQTSEKFGRIHATNNIPLPITGPLKAVIEVGHEFTYQGYEFKLSSNFPLDVAEKIFDYIKGVVDEMPI